MKFLVTSLSFLIWLFPYTGFAQTNSVLNSGEWYMFSVSSEGIFKIDYNLLKQAGIKPDEIDPRNIQVFSGHVGMLPQLNSAHRISDLQEVAIQVSGESDGKFNTNDVILFYGQGPDEYRYHPSSQMFQYANHLYDDNHFYFLTISSQPGKRISGETAPSGTFPLVTTYDDFGFYETEKYNILKSGRQWFGEQFDAALEATIRFDIPGIVENAPVRFASHVMGQTFTDASFDVFWNGISILTQPISPVPNSTYAIKGRMKIDSTSVNSNVVNASSRVTQEVKYRFQKGTGFSVGYLDFFSFTLTRRLALYGDLTFFQSQNSLANPISTFQIINSDASVQVWNVTDHWNVMTQSSTQQGTVTSFNSSTTELKRFVVFKPDRVKTPAFQKKIGRQNLHQLPVPELVIISHPAFLEEATRLANHRVTFNNLVVQVVTTQQVYNEYSGGKQDVSAIRDFIKNLYDRDPKLKNVLLVGRGSYDYKNRVSGNTNFVPIYESRNSLSPLETYSSDDYFTFLSPSDGDWNESPAVNHAMVIGVGRLPVKTLEEARIIVNKLIDYDKNPKTYGAWRNEVSFVADDGDFNIHQSQADLLAQYIQDTQPHLQTRKVYIDLFKQENRPSGQRSPQATENIQRTISDGATIINFTGHGSEQVWMDERVLDGTVIQDWKRLPHAPLFVTATCEFGRNDDPQQITTGEKILLQKEGAIGLVTTARPVNSSTNFTLNREFYEALFIKENNKYRSLGEVVRDTKNNSQSGVANRNFSLLGDPSMVLNFGQAEISIDEVKTLAGDDGIKALSTVRIKGSITSNNQIQTGFNGIADLTVFNKRIQTNTRGDENPVFSFLNFDDRLFRGQATVSEGEFEVTFIAPKTIANQVGQGKITAYAYANDRSKDASGARINVSIGGEEATPASDTTPPLIELFMGDTTYVEGGVVGPQTAIVAKLFDDNGITLTPHSDHSMIAILNDTLTFDLSSNYFAFKDSFQRGYVSFPVFNLAAGRHVLSLSASDTYLNRTTRTLTFVVSEGGGIQIQDFHNFPNPFEAESGTTFQFIHSRPGDDLEAQIIIYSPQGLPILKKTFEVLSSYYQVTLTQWDGLSTSGIKLNPGIYFSKLIVRSRLDGSQNEQITKLLLVN